MGGFGRFVKMFSWVFIGFGLMSRLRKQKPSIYFPSINTSQAQPGKLRIQYLIIVTIYTEQSFPIFV